MPAAPPSPEPTAEQAAAVMRSKQFVVLLVIVSVIGVIVSLAAWCFLELIHQIQTELYTHLPHALGYPNGAPKWWSLPVLAIAGLIVALAITRLPGNGGHIPANGLAAGGPTNPIDLPGIVLAGLATIASGLVLGPEAPLIAIGAGVAVLTLRLARREMPNQVLVLVAAAGSFAAVSFIFESPLIAAVILIEASGIGGARLPMLLVPGLLAAGIGTLVSIGMGSFTGLSSSAYALGPLSLPHFGHPTPAQFGWTILFAIAVALVTRVIMLGGLGTLKVVRSRALVLLPAVGLIVAGLAIAFSGATGKSVNEVLFSGQDALPGLVSQSSTWSLSALALLIGFKGVAYSLSLGSFRGGPTFPAMFIGAAGGIALSHLPGLPPVAGAAMGIGAMSAVMLRLPLTSVLLATLLLNADGLTVMPLVIVAVVVAYVTAARLEPVHPTQAATPGAATAPPQPPTTQQPGSALPSARED